MNRIPEVGEKVYINSFIYALKHRKNKNGIVTNVNGWYILVKPMWCNWEVELYPCELKEVK